MPTNPQKERIAQQIKSVSLDLYGNMGDQQKRQNFLRVAGMAITKVSIGFVRSVIDKSLPSHEEADKLIDILHGRA